MRLYFKTSRDCKVTVCLNKTLRSSNEDQRFHHGTGNQGPGSKKDLLPKVGEGRSALWWNAWGMELFPQLGDVSVGVGEAGTDDYLNNKTT